MSAAPRGDEGRLPDKAYAKPAKPRKLLVYGVNNQSPAHGFVHSSIAIQSYMMKEMGEKLGTWTTTISYNPRTSTRRTSSSTTRSCSTARQGASSISLVTRRPPMRGAQRCSRLCAAAKASAAFTPQPTRIAARACPNDLPAAGAPAGGGGRGAAAAAPAGPGGQLASTILTQADKNTDQKVTMAEISALANEWFDKMDTAKAGRIAQADFAARYAAAQPPPGRRRGWRRCRGAGAGANAGASAGRSRVTRASRGGSLAGVDQAHRRLLQVHWGNGTHIPVKLDDPKSPLTVMFEGKGFEVIDETYTFAQDSFSRTNVHVLTSVDYAKMPQATKDQEPADTARNDGDYALSYIRREGNGRVFYEASGHDESIYAMKNMSLHYLALMQYAMGDLKADDSPSVKAVCKK
jgi:hypothetical protein